MSQFLLNAASSAIAPVFGKEKKTKLCLKLINMIGRANAKTSSICNCKEEQLMSSKTFF